MTLKKIAVTTVAASLVFGALVGPLSSNGLAEKLGVSVASAYANPPFTDALTLAKINKIHDALVAISATDIAIVRAARDEVRGLTDSNVINPLWNEVDQIFTSTEQPAIKSDLFEFMKKIAITYYADGRYLEYLKEEANTTYSDSFGKLTSKAGVTLADITTNDFAVFMFGSTGFNGLEFYMKAKLAALSPLELIDVINDVPGKRQAVLVAAFTDVLSQTNVDTNKIAKILKYYNNTVSTNTIAATVDTIHNLETAVPNGKDAAKAMIYAYMRSESSVSVATSNNGRTATLGLSIAGRSIPTADGLLVTWFKVSGDATVTTTGVATIADSAISGSAVVKAIVRGKVLYEGPISLAYSTSPVIVIPVTPTPTPTFDEQLKDLGDKLAKAPEAEKAAIIDQILDAAKAAVAKLAEIKPEVKVAGNVATADIKTSDVVKQMQDIKATIDKALKATGTTVAPEVTITLNLGQVTAGKIDAPIAKEILEAAKANGVTNIAVVVNGISLSLPISEFDDNVTLTIAKSTQTTTAVTATELFDIDLTVGGKAQSEFNHKLTLSLPVKDVAKFDKDLLVVAKVVDGKLQIIGGSLKGDNVAVPRDGLSTYTVVENKVSFNDLTKVQAWAGRQIEVAAAKGILEGRQAGTFDPSANITRAEFAKLIVKTFFLEDKKATEAFADVSADAWYGPYVAAAAKLGIITGRDTNTFDPNAKISRAEMATMAARALKLVDAGVAKVDIAASLKDFKDASSISASLKEGVAIAASQGIVIGDKGSFKPQGNSTRAEAAVIIYRLLKSQE